MIAWLAEIASGFSAESVGTIIGVFLVTLISAGVITGKVANMQRVRVDSGHMEISMREKFLTRSEFLEFKGDIKSDVREMKVLYEKALMFALERDERSANDLKNLGEQLHKRISDGDEAGAERRRTIHEQINLNTNSITRIETHTNLGKDLGKLGAAIMTLAKKEHV